MFLPYFILNVQLKNLKLVCEQSTSFLCNVHLHCWHLHRSILSYSLEITLLFGDQIESRIQSLCSSKVLPFFVMYTYIVARNFKVDIDLSYLTRLKVPCGFVYLCKSIVCLFMQITMCLCLLHLHRHHPWFSKFHFLRHLSQLFLNWAKGVLSRAWTI